VQTSEFVRKLYAYVGKRTMFYLAGNMHRAGITNRRFKWQVEREKYCFIKHFNRREINFVSLRCNPAGRFP
jgi:hypothetical protein